MKAGSRMNNTYKSLQPCVFTLHRGSSTNTLTHTCPWAANMTPRISVAMTCSSHTGSIISRASSIIRIIAPYQTLTEVNPLSVLSIRSSARGLLRCLCVLEGFSPIRPLTSRLFSRVCLAIASSMLAKGCHYAFRLR